MTDQPTAPSRVTVVMRTKDRELLLHRALASVAAQTYPHYTVVVVNDGGSPLDPSTLPAGFAPGGERADRLVLVENAEPAGRWAAANQGVAAHDGRYVVLHDDDDTWEPGFLEHTVAFLDGNEGYAGVVAFTDIVTDRVYPEGAYELGRQPFARDIEHITLHEMCRHNLFPPIAFLYRRSLHDELGPYDESMRVLADWEFNLRVLRRHDIGMVREPLANWHLREEDSGDEFGNVTLSRQTEYEEDRARLLNKLLREDLDHGAPGVGWLVNRLYFEDQAARLREQPWQGRYDELVQHVAQVGEHTVEAVDTHAGARAHTLLEAAEKQAEHLDERLDAIGAALSDIRQVAGGVVRDVASRLYGRVRRGRND
ncbi:glycosyltransferase family A protein [Gryllotalpicola ginsengisoli]|uniref:glycosyltransferase family A protein n=1 Tax=Gryllotalpicola ginsengisoli TaxID=444608 RepID=UPI000429DE7E|nr:glycosyltransferase family A protein [Gryllotalpicola ginsengisoli]